ncbi:hypothetical protein J4Q44_G00124580 [Coregonus suidteri]|uniref:Uncharacterized protein n=1 Tax=Coregonus suidteri TaxID=861788 RepID=A0AAN8QZR1_9TELE
MLNCKLVGKIRCVFSDSPNRASIALPGRERWPSISLWVKIVTWWSRGTATWRPC